MYTTPKLSLPNGFKDQRWKSNEDLVPITHPKCNDKCSKLQHADSAPPPSPAFSLVKLTAVTVKVLSNETVTHGSEELAHKHVKEL